MSSASFGSRFRAFMNHPAGPKTVFFWAPMMKWGLVVAGLGDLARPADKLSVSQNAALAVTGMIWVRYCFVITPVNYPLAAVNFFVGTTGLVQLARVAQYVFMKDLTTSHRFTQQGSQVQLPAITSNKN